MKLEHLSSVTADKALKECVWMIVLVLEIRPQQSEKGTSYLK